MKKIVLLIICFISCIAFAQEKRIWAKSFLHQKAPKLVVEKWLSDKPDTSGKFVLVDFWATWCGPCKKAIPKLNSFHQKFMDKLVVIGISDEPKYKVRNQKNPELAYFSAIDTKQRMKRIFEVRGIPHCVIINPEGVVVWEGWPDLAGYELTSEVIEALIQEN